MSDQEHQPEGSPAEASPGGTSFRLIPSGALVAAICFFLPWVKMDCMGEVKRASGADLGDSLWIVLAAAVAILLLSILFRARHQAPALKTSAIIGALVGLGTMAYAWIRITQGRETEFGRISASDLGLTIEFGAIGSAIGLLLSLAGALGLKAPHQARADPE